MKTLDDVCFLAVTVTLGEGCDRLNPNRQNVPKLTQ